MLHDFDEINGILAAMAEEGMIEPMIEPCDEDNVHPLDWADAVGLFDEVADILYPQEVDRNHALYYTVCCVLYWFVVLCCIEGLLVYEPSRPLV